MINNDCPNPTLVSDETQEAVGAEVNLIGLTYLGGRKIIPPMSLVPLAWKPNVVRPSGFFREKGSSHF